MKIPTFLPIFNGFYGSYWEDNNIESESEYLETEGIYITKFLSYKLKNTEDSKLLSDFLNDNFNWKDYYNELSKAFCDVVANEIEFINNIEFEQLISPRYYNFTNDSINCIIDINLGAFREWIFNNTDFIDKQLKERYTSCDGFISHYPNNFEDWQLDTNNFTKLEGHYLGALLNIYAEYEEIEEDILYEYSDIWPSEFYEYKTENLLNEIKEKEIDIIEEFKDPNQLNLALKES